MTRKRKVTNDDTTGDDPLSGYGYVNQRAAASSKPSTPASNDRRSAESSRVENKRARWSANSDAREIKEYHKEEPFDSEPSDKNSFPTELVSYLRHIVSTLGSEEPDQLILSKCLEECDGEEVNLLGYQESCRLLETIFGKSKFGAFGFMKKLNRLKRVKWLNLIYNGCSARTIETLLLALQPVDEQSLEEIVTGWKDLIVDDWNNLVMDANGIHLIRSLARLLLGLPKSDTKAELKTATTTVKPKFANSDVEKQLRRDFQQLNNLALDYGSMKDYIGRPTVSLLMQDFAEMDACLKCGQCRQFVSKALENPDEIEEWWKDKEASRVWEKLVTCIDEDLRQTLFASALSGRLRDLAAHRYANYPLQRMISLSKSEESVMDILELTEDFEALLDMQRSGVVIAVLQCVANHEEEQERVIKALRHCFHAEKKRNKLHLAPSVLCLNNADVSEENSSIKFNVSKSTLQGSLIVQHLLNLHHHKSILGSLLEVSAECLMEMAKHPLASHTLDSAFRSKKILMQDKLQLARKINWDTLAGDKYGSRVFEAYWELAEVPTESRERILESLARSNSEDKSPIFRLICSKLKVKEFAQNRNLWRQNLTRQATTPTAQQTKSEGKGRPQPNKAKILPVNDKPAVTTLTADASAAAAGKSGKRQGRKRGVCLLRSILSTPEDPELTFEHLYQFGKNEYTSKNWHDCISFLLRATEDYRYYRDETIWCRQKCAMQISEIPPTINESTETVASIRLMYAQAQKALCLLRCRAEKLTPQRPPLSNYAIYEEFQNRRQYHYLQICHWKMGDLRSAVKSAFTHLVANPDNQESLDNVKFYMTQPGYNEDMLVDALQMRYEKYYISATEAYNAGEWQRCVTDFQESLKLFFEEEQECRMVCEDYLDWSSLEGDNPETSIVITSIYASVVRCRAKCVEKLSKVNGHHISNFLASYFEYLHVCYYKLNRGRDACQAVANAILLDPSNIVMRRNKLFYTKSYQKQDLFVPSDDVVEYHSRTERERRFLDFIDSRFKYVDGTLPTESIQDRTVFDTDVDIEDRFDYTRLEGDLLSADECKRLSTAATLPEQAVKYTRNLIAEVGKRIAEGYRTEPEFHSLTCSSHAVASGCTRSAFVLSVDEQRCSSVLSDVFDGCALVFCTK